MNVSATKRTADSLDERIAVQSEHFEGVRGVCFGAAIGSK